MPLSKTKIASWMLTVVAPNNDPKLNEILMPWISDVSAYGTVGCTFEPRRVHGSATTTYDAISNFLFPPFAIPLPVFRLKAVCPHSSPEHVSR
jgi:hypothetical protein